MAENELKYKSTRRCKVQLKRHRQGILDIWCLIPCHNSSLAMYVGAQILFNHYVQSIGVLILLNWIFNERTATQFYWVVAVRTHHFSWPSPARDETSWTFRTDAFLTHKKGFHFVVYFLKTYRYFWKQNVFYAINWRFSIACVVFL